MIAAHARSFTRFLFQTRLAWLILIVAVLLVPVWQRALTAQSKGELILLNSSAIDPAQRTAKLALDGGTHLRLIQFA